MSITLEDLFADKLDPKFRDKVFWFASHIKIDEVNNQVDIYIDSNDCLVAFDDIADELKIKAISQIANIDTSQGITDNPVLVSSGSFLWINDKLVVTQRTADTKYDPLHWTTPAGRCDTTPLKTAYKETAEEIHGFNTVSNQLYMPKPCLPFLADKEVIGYEVANCFPNGVNVPTATVNTWVDNELVETADMWFYYSQSVNTLELRVPISANMDNELRFKDVEFTTKAQLMSVKELQEVYVVPAVKNLLVQLIHLRIRR